jgi:hypothetical protein
MTLTIDLIDNGVLTLLQDMERLNLLRVNPPAESSAPDKAVAALNAEIAGNPPDFSEFCCLCDEAKKLNIPHLYTCEEIFDEAAKRTQGPEAIDYKRKAKRIRYYSSHRELWDETTRMIREMRDEWDDPWEKAAQKNG